MRARQSVFASLVVSLLVSHTSQALPISTKKGLVVAAHPVAARVGAEILARGGNAADALTATAFALAVVEPHSSGLGGGGFALYYDAKTGEVHALDFRETAPAAASAKLFMKDGKYDAALSRMGGRSIAVPGAVAGYAYVASHFGTRPLSQLVEPAASIAEHGVVLRAGDCRAIEMGKEVLAHSPKAAAFYGLHREVLGEVRKNLALAAFLKTIAAEGPRAFYGGAGGAAILRAAAADGGVLTSDDLAHYEVRTLKPLEGSYRGHRIVTIPPPSAGGVTILATLAAFEKVKPPTGPEHYADPTRLHDLVELWNRAYAARSSYIGDPRAETVVSKYVQRILAPATSTAWAKSVGPRATPASEINPLIDRIKEGDDTTHLCAVDAQGNVALMTTTVNGPFGSGVFVPELGIVLNNEMDDFAAPSGGNLYGLVGGKYNAVAPGKTPVSTMSPTIVFDGAKPWIALGAPGGSTIATTITQVILHVIDDGMDIQRAVSAPRIHTQFLPDEIKIEPTGLEAATIQALESKGHKVVVSPQTFGNAQALMIGADGVRSGASDPRGVGAAVAEDEVELAK